jgi:hypothetical protein
MPFGEKPDLDGKFISFDTVYKYIIKAVVEDRLGLKCIRSDEVMKPGWVHSDMLKHIFLDDVVIVDITTLNANVFYELGVRHALRSSITILIRKKGTKLPFNIRGLRVIDYDLDIESANRAQDDIERFIRSGLEEQSTDSIVYNVFPNLKISLE